MCLIHIYCKYHILGFEWTTNQMGNHCHNHICYCENSHVDGCQASQYQQNKKEKKPQISLRKICRKSAAVADSIMKFAARFSF
ncbi:hypothetical protein L1987_00633 [Smallanthus sonchifolius]|uniref:Uncharacterized protein n=1 Tax=Smallanthus sonchifolius TaxID=185202 RepID=A0ACB9K309_9ASTR|nr:hypothetical protein L1987_00633 [Smallanthus sonchifolius]